MFMLYNQIGTVGSLSGRYFNIFFFNGKLVSQKGVIEDKGIFACIFNKSGRGLAAFGIVCQVLK